MAAGNNNGAPAPRGSGQIVVCGMPYAIDWPVVNFRDIACAALEGITNA